MHRSFKILGIDITIKASNRENSFTVISFVRVFFLCMSSYCINLCHKIMTKQRREKSGKINRFEHLSTTKINNETWKSLRQNYYEQIIKATNFTYNEIKTTGFFFFFTWTTCWNINNIGLMCATTIITTAKKWRDEPGKCRLTQKTFVS